MSHPKYLKDANGFCYAYTPELARMAELTPHDGAIDKDGFAKGHKAPSDPVNHTADTTDAEVKGVAVDGTLVAQSAQPGVLEDTNGLTTPVIMDEDTIAGKPRAPKEVEGVATDPEAEQRHPSEDRENAVGGKTKAPSKKA